MADKGLPPSVRDDEFGEPLTGGGFADAGLANQHADGALTTCGGRESRLQLVHLRFASDEGRLVREPVPGHLTLEVLFRSR
jgi:hypothetical protein